MSNTPLLTIITNFKSEKNADVLNKLKHQHGASFESEIEVLNIKDNISVIDALNEAKLQSKGKYIAFIDDDIEFDEIDLKKVLSNLKNINESVIGLQLISDLNNEANKIETQYYLSGGIKSHLMILGRYIFRKDVIENIYFEKTYEKYYRDEFLLNVFWENDKIYFIQNATVKLTIPNELDLNRFELQNEKEWYNEYFSQLVLPLLNRGEVPYQIQALVFYLLKLRFRCNMNGRDKFTIEGEEIDTFIEVSKEVLNYVDDHIILQSGSHKILPRTMDVWFYEHKYGRYNTQAEFRKNDKNEYIGYIDEIEACDINRLKIDIKAINDTSTGITFECEFLGSQFFNKDNIKIVLQLNDKFLPINEIEIYSLTKFFGRSAVKGYMFNVEVPWEEIQHDSKLTFKVRINNEEVPLDCTFSKAQSRLNEKRKTSYYVVNGHIMKYKAKTKTIDIKKASKVKVLFNELLFLLGCIFTVNDGIRAKKAAILRIAYWFTKRKYGSKDTWIYFDKLYKAGDNGEYFFNYCYNKDDGRDVYYIVNNDSHDYNRLKEEYGNNIVEFNSFRNKLITLHADMIFATHSNIYQFCGLGKKLQEFLKDLMTADVVCIQHGLTIQDIAQYQNRLFDNTKLYTCASPYEIKNLSKKIYGYHDNALQLTGVARYDGLINNDKKQILITPTWRRNIAIAGNKIGTSREYNENFKYTEYFRIYNSLINDKKLIETAEKTGYKIVFLLHPVTSCQISDFKKPADCVDVIPAIGDMSYEKILTESSLMVTDYSGVQFDFAYMRKPLVYYHPKTLPPQYDDGGMNYETMGFGDICVDHESLIETLCGYMLNNCIMEDKYVKRVRDFFPYDDFNNRERMYIEVENYLKNR